MNDLNSIPFIGSEPNFELQNGGRVLILPKALLGPTGKFHDIRIERTSSKFLGFDLGKCGDFNAITQEEVRQIQITYAIALKTLNVAPGEAQLRSSVQESFYSCRPDAHEKKSLSYGEQKDDVVLSSEDAARFGEKPMTLHDLLTQGGIWGPVKKRAPAPAPILPISTDLKPKEVVVVKTTPSTSSSPQRAPSHTSSQAAYCTASMGERIRRITEHLDKSNPELLFSSFIKDKAPEKMVQALAYLAEDPSNQESDAKEMRKLLECWFKAAYKYLYKNSIPAEEKAKNDPAEKEKYWRFAAAQILLDLLFQNEEIDTSLLHDSLSKIKF